MPRSGPGEYASRGHHSPNRSVKTSKACSGEQATQRCRTIGAAASPGRGSVSGDVAAGVGRLDSTKTIRLLNGSITVTTRPQGRSSIPGFA